MPDHSTMSSEDMLNTWTENFLVPFQESFDERLKRLRDHDDPEGLETLLDFDIADDRERDITQLEEVGLRILENEASNEDYKVVRDMAAKYMPNQMFKFSPRLMGREASLESLEGLKRYAGAGVALAIILAIIALIDQLFGKEESKGGGGTSADIKRFNQAKEACERAMEQLAQSAPTLRPLAGPISRLSEEDVKEIISKAKDEEALMKLSAFKTLSQVIERQSGLKDQDLRTAVLAVVRVAAKYSALLGTEGDFSKLREHFEQGLDLHKTLNTEVFTANRNKWCRMAFLSANGFTPSAELETAHKVLKDSLNAFSSYRQEIDKMVGALESNSEFDWGKFNGVASAILQGYGIDVDAAVLTDTKQVLPPTKVPMTAEESKALNDKMKVHFELLEPTQVVAKNVLSKLIGADHPKLIRELETFDEMIDASTTLKDWIEKSGSHGSLIDLMKKLDELKKSESTKPLGESKIGSVNLTIRLVQTMMRVAGNMVTCAGNFQRGVSRVSVEFANFSTKFLEIAKLVEKLDGIERTPSNESILEDRTGELPTPPEDEPTNNNELGLHMREVHIPKGVILPHGIDIPALRDLVEEDPSDWSQEELGEYIEGSNASLESLYRDLNEVSLIAGRIRRTGMISRRDVQALEEIHPGLITSQTPIGRFTSFESVNYARPSLENAAKLAGGAQAVAAVAAVAILAKILQWCYKRFQASRDVTKSIKGAVDVMSKLNDQTISLVTGSNDRVSALSVDMQGRLNKEAREYYSEKLLGNDWYNIQDVEKSLMKMRTMVFAKNHKDSFSELIESMVKGEDAFKLVQVLTQACEKGVAVLDKAVDNAAHQIDQLKSDGGNGNTETTFKGLDYGLDSFRIKDLDLSKAQGNIGRAELITTYVQTKKDTKLGKEEIKNVEVDKLNARLLELAEKLKEVNGRAESDFKKIQQRLEKLEKSNAAATEKENTDGSKVVSREAVKAYIDSIQAEFNAYSKIVGAHKAILTVVDSEIKKYGSTLKEWNKLVNWHNKQVSSLAKEKPE